METLLRAGLSNALAATFMALSVTCLSRPLARRPAVLHGLWLLVLLKLVTPPFYEVPIPWPASTSPPARVSRPVTLAEVETVASVVVRDEPPDDPRDVAAVRLATDAEPEASRPSPAPLPAAAASLRLYRWISSAWLAGSAAVLVLSIRRIRRFQRLLADARGASWLEQEWVDEWGRRLGLRRAPELRWVPGRISPMVWCVGLRPLLLVPEELWKRLDAPQRSTLLAHELAHLRRGDHLVRLLELLVAALYWWHPLVWWMRGPLRDVEEQCCDAWVVWALPDAVRAYAETLLDTLEFLSQSGRAEPLLASGLGRAPHLRRRLTMIMTGCSRRLPGRAGKLGLLMVAGAMLPIGASQAQKAEDSKDVRVIVRQAEDRPDVRGDAAAASDRQEQVQVRAVAPTATESFVYLTQSDDQGHQTTVIRSPSDQVIVEKLQEQIAALKDAEPSDARSQQIQALTQAIEQILKTGEPTKPLTFHAEIVDVANVATVGHSVQDASEVAKLDAEVSRLRKNLETTLKELQATQEKIRKLGGDPGERPTVQWIRTPTRFRYNVARVSPEAVKRVRVFEANVAADHGDTVSRPVAASSESRLQTLEKQLKALQDEVGRLKIGSAKGEEKK